MRGDRAAHATTRCLCGPTGPVDLRLFDRRWLSTLNRIKVYAAAASASRSPCGDGSLASASVADADFAFRQSAATSAKE